MFLMSSFANCEGYPRITMKVFKIDYCLGKYSTVKHPIQTLKKNSKAIQMVSVSNKRMAHYLVQIYIYFTVQKHYFCTIYLIQRKSCIDLEQLLKTHCKWNQLSEKIFLGLVNSLL